MDRYLVIDLASVRFVWAPGRAALSVQLATGESVGVTEVPPDMTEREAAIRALDAAMDRGRIVRHDTDGKIRARLAFYNPYIAEVAVGGLPATRAFTDGRPLVLDAGGSLAVLDGDTLRIGARILTVRAPSAEALVEAWAAHRR